jgi:hypothetical protein
MPYHMHARILLHEYGATITISLPCLHLDFRHPPSQRMLGGLGDEDLHGNSGLANKGWALICWPQTELEPSSDQVDEDLHRNWGPGKVGWATTRL